MESSYQTTAFVKQDPELALTTNCPFLAPEPSDCNKEPFASMDLAGFLGGKVVPDQADRSGTDWNSLFSGELDDLDFLDPSTGMPTSVMAELPNANVGIGDSVNSRGSQMLNGDGSSSSWLFEQTQKLEKQQQLQQQRLFELQQTLLQTEILKNQLQIANNLKSNTTTSIPSSQHSQLLGSSNNSPSNSATTTSASNLGTSSHQFSFDGMCGITSTPQLSPTPTLSNALTSISQEKDSLDCFEEPETKKKSHNLIEKKYRTSINDRIGLLRDIVSKHFKDDKKAQKSAVLQKTIDYIRFLENANRRLLEENKRLKSLLKGSAQPTVPDTRLPPRHEQVLKSLGSTSLSPSACSSSQGPSPQSLTESSDEGHPSSPDVFLSDQSAQNSPKLQSQVSTSSSSFLFTQFTSSPQSGIQLSRAANRFLLCFMLVAIFLVDPLALISRGAQPASVHGSQRTLSGFELSSDASPGEFTLGVALVWAVRILVALSCFGLVWLYALPKISDDKEGVKFWRYRKQAELDIKKGDLSSAQRNVTSALAEVGMAFPISYSSLTLSLIWHTVCHVMFQLYVGRVAIWLVQIFRQGISRPNQDGKKMAQSVSHSDVAQCLHLLHQLSLSSYERIKMHGIGFYLGLSALNFAEVASVQFSKEQWAEMMFAMGVQCQFSCACVASLIARYYFLCAGSVGGLLSFATTESGWEYLLSKHWVRDVQVSSKLYHGVAAFPKYSVARSYYKALLTDSLRDLLLPNQQDSSSIEECLENFISVLDVSRSSSTYIINDIKLLTGGALNLSDALATQDSGFSELMWWASVGIIATHWQNGDTEKAEEHYVVIEELCEQSAPVAALHLAFKAQQMHHSANQPPLSVIMQLCSLASDSLKTCEQTMSSEDTLHQLGLLLACDWLLCLRYSLWQSCTGSVLGSNPSEERASRQLCSGYGQDVDMLAHLVTVLPASFHRLNMYKGYQHAMSGGNPVHTDTLLRGTAPSSVRQRTVLSTTDS